MMVSEMISRASSARRTRSLKKLQVIYEPAGRAREYATRAVNLFSGCDHGCVYCYAPGATHKTRAAFGVASPRKDILAKLNSDCAILARQDIEPVLMCFTCDPYQNCEDGLTRKAINIFRSYDVPFQILTKGGTRATRDFNLYSSRDVFASSLTFTDAGMSREWEPGAALPTGRIKALELAHDMGIETWASLEPVIDPIQSLRLIEICADFVDLFKVGPLNHHPAGKTIDWHRFGVDAIGVLESLGKKYYIKNDLNAHL